MPYEPQDRATFVALLAHLGPGESRDPVVAFVRDHWSESLEELGARPGADQVRAGLLRIVPPLLSIQERAEVLSAARDAVSAYPQDVADHDPSLLVARHPAWVGICALELAALDGEPRAAGLARAVSLASEGFRSGGPTGQDVGRGEVLWAMAEQVEDLGWTDRSRELLEAALAGPFADPDHQRQVQLLLGMRRLEDDDPAGLDLLESLAGDDAAEEQLRVHASWVLAAAARERGEVDAARVALDRALSLVDPDAEPDIAARIRAAAAELDDPGDDWDGEN